MKEKNTNEKEQRGRRFHEAVDGPEIRRCYAHERTEDIAGVCEDGSEGDIFCGCKQNANCFSCRKDSFYVLLQC